MSTHRYSKYFPIIFLGLDLLSLNVGFAAANILKFDSFFAIRNYYLDLQVVLNVIWILTFFSANLQNIKREHGIIDILNNLLTALTINLSIVFALWFIAKPFYLSRQHLAISYAIFAFLSIFWRLIWNYAIRYYRARGFNFRNVVVVGYSDLSKNLVRYFQESPGLGYKFLGYFDTFEQNDKADSSVRELSDLENYCADHKVDFIYAYAPRLKNEQLKEIIDLAENNLIKVKIISQLSELSHRHFQIENHGSISVVNLTAIPLDNKVNQIVKRAFDIIFSSIVIITVLSWMIPIIAFLIKIESKGPIFFRQERTGLNNRKFRIFKFRTMVVHHDKNVKQAEQNDPRITRLGAILRKSSIDEFPQFLNVFIGDMSVVGPRPHAIKHNLEFAKKIDRFAQRHAMKPGITGLAQAKGFRGETKTMSELSGRIKLDRFYVKNWSILLDFKIIILTILSVIRGDENAY